MSLDPTVPEPIILNNTHVICQSAVVDVVTQLFAGQSLISAAHAAWRPNPRHSSPLRAAPSTLRCETTPT